VSAAHRLLLSPRTAADLEEIADYIARDNPVRAASFVAELEATCRAVAASPQLYPARSDLAPGLRMAVHGRYISCCTATCSARTRCASSACCTVPATCRGSCSRRSGLPAARTPRQEARQGKISCGACCLKQNKHLQGSH
jgi:toxin ParE1/3/4